MWETFIAQKADWIGGMLQELDHDGPMSPEFPGADTPTEITDLVYDQHEHYSLFSVVGKDFTCSFNTNYGGIFTGATYEDYDLVMGTAYGRFAIKRRAKCENKSSS